MNPQPLRQLPSVEDGLRARLAEWRCGGGEFPSQETWLRRFPAHRDAIDRVFEEFHAVGPDPDRIALGGEPEASEPEPHESSPAVAPLSEVRSAKSLGSPARIAAEASGDPMDEPSLGFRVERQDSHGRLERNARDGRRRYVIPAERLAGNNPATAYVLRARRFQAAAVPGVQAPQVDSLPDGSVAVTFESPPGTTVTLPFASHGQRGFTRRLLEIVGRIAARLQMLHERGAAHGRIDLNSIYVDPESRRVTLDAGLSDGPGLDTDALDPLQERDIRHLGAILYGGLCLEGGSPELREIIHRADQGELPSLTSRRPDLSLALVRLVEKALRRRSGDGFGTAGALLTALDQLQDHEIQDRALKGNAPWWRRQGVLTGLAILILGLGAHLAFRGTSQDPDEPRLSVKPSDPRLEAIERLVRDGRLDEARAALEALGEELGVGPPTPGVARRGG